jgi:CDP-glucose 4,6-dehydratase
MVTSGPRLAAGRAGNVIGGGDFAADRLLPDLIRSITSGEAVEIRNPNSTRPWQHALDPLMGYMLAMNAILNGDNSNAYNFGPTDSSLSVREVLDIAQSAWGEIRIHELESSESSLEARTLDLDSTKAKIELDWKPAWSQQEAILSTINWWKSYLSNPATAQERTEEDITYRLNSG